MVHEGIMALIYMTTILIPQKIITHPLFLAPNGTVRPRAVGEVQEKWQKTGVWKFFPAARHRPSIGSSPIGVEAAKTH